MKNLIIAIYLLSSSGLTAQTRLDSVSKFATYISKNKTYQIQYNVEHWQIGTDSTKWDVEFHDVHNILKAYFSAFNYFISERKLKENLKSQYKQIGKIKSLKTHKKKLNQIEGDYFECELKYEGYIYKYQGFVFSSQNGSAELQFGGQEESINKNQKLIDEFWNGVTELK